MQTELTVEHLYDLTHTAAAPLLSKCTYPWEALADIKAFILQLGPTLFREISLFFYFLCQKA